MYKIFTEIIPEKLIQPWYREKKRFLMRISFIYVFLLVSGIQFISASNSHGQSLDDIMVTVKVNERNLEFLIKNIELQTDLTFAYLPSDLRKYTSISLRTGRQSVKSVLDQALQNTGLSYRYVENSIIIFPKAIKVQRNPGNPKVGGINIDELRKEKISTGKRDKKIDFLSSRGITEIINKRLVLDVTGQVTDAAGEPLIGVNVQVKGTNTGTATDIDGRFSVNDVDDLAVLVFSYIGYKSQEVAVNGKSNLIIVMEEDVQTLDEVVVVGYGTAKKGDLTGAISTVSTKDFDKIPATNPLQAIQGRASGLQITTNSGLPGSGGDVLIRGTQSINGSNSPIYVVDGVITGGINNLNPNNIESVSVLKDASASAIYGARAANGVVLVTTKRGVGKRTPEITLNAYNGIQNESNLRLDLLNADQFLELWTESYTNAGLDIPWDADILSYYDGVDTDWKSLMTQTGHIQSYDLSVSGGSEKSNYYVSAGYLNQKGMIIETGYKKYTLNFNSDYTIADWIKFGNSLNVYATAREGDSEPYNTALRKVPLTRAYEDDGDYGKIFNSTLEHINANPIWLAKNKVYDRNGKGLQGNIYLTLDLLEGLDFTARGSVDYSNSYNSDFDSGVPPRYGWEGTNVNLVSKRHGETVHWIGDFLLNYSKNINEVHKIKALAGYSLEESSTEFLEGSRTGTPNDEIRFLNAGDPLSQLNENGFTDWAFASVFGRLNYTFDNKYLITATIRRDGTSRLTEANRYGVFPSGSIAWRLSEESFMDNVRFIDDLKLRASVGTLGNILSVGPYGTISSLSQRQAVINQGAAQAYTLTSAVNSDLKWEAASKKNLGIDASLYNGKLYTTLNYFIEDTYDLLFSDPIPPSTGLSGSPLINAGEVRNTGFELELGYRVAKTNWSYDFSINLSHVNNEVIDLDGRDLRTSGLVEGYPVRSFFGYKANGIITNESQLDIYQEGSFTKKQIGDIALLDVDGYDEDGNLLGKPDGKVNAADRTLIGNRYPDLIYGGLGTVSYKNWSLQFLLQGVQGVDLNFGPNNSTDVITLMSQWAKNEDARILQRYDANNNPNGTWPRLSKSQTGSNDVFSEFWLEDASYLRIKNANLNYNLPDRICERIGMSILGVYVSVQNAFTFTDYGGPEVDTTSDPLTGIPQPRTWTLGLKATF